MIKKADGPKRSFDTGANKQNADGKGTPVLFPGDAYLEIAKHFEDGATHYGARNWEKGIPLSELMNSLERHIAQEKMGLTDESHARAIAWNAVVYLATKIRIENGQLPDMLADIPGIPNSIVRKEKVYKGCRDCKHACESPHGYCAGCFGTKEHKKWEPKI